MSYNFGFNILANWYEREFEMKKRIVSVVCLGILFFMILSGCGKRYTDEEIAQIIEEARTEAVDESVNEDKDTVDEESASEVSIDTESDADSENKTQESSSGTDKPDDVGATMSEDWTQMQFVFDGKQYQIPFAYKDLEAEGWSFDLADYGYDSGYVLNPGDYVSGTIHLEKEGYERNEVDVAIGFINNSDEVKDILACEIYSFTLQTNLWLTADIQYPQMTIAKNIGIGSSYDEVKEAFGNPSEFYDDTENECYYISYDVDYTYILDMTISKERGVSTICIEKR